MTMTPDEFGRYLADDIAEVGAHRQDLRREARPVTRRRRASRARCDVCSCAGAAQGARRRRSTRTSAPRPARRSTARSAPSARCARSSLAGERRATSIVLTAALIAELERKDGTSCAGSARAARQRAHRASPCARASRCPTFATPRRCARRCARARASCFRIRSARRPASISSTCCDASASTTRSPRRVATFPNGATAMRALARLARARRDRLHAGHRDPLHAGRRAGRARCRRDSSSRRSTRRRCARERATARLAQRFVAMAGRPEMRRCALRGGFEF